MTNREMLVVAAGIVTAIVVLARWPEVRASLDNTGVPRAATYGARSWERCEPPYCGLMPPGSRIQPRPFPRSGAEYWRQRAEFCRRFPRMPNPRVMADGGRGFFPPGMPWDSPMGMPTSWRGPWCAAAAGTACSRTGRRPPICIVA